MISTKPQASYRLVPILLSSTILSLSLSPFPFAPSLLLSPAVALPPADDIPEEVLRTHIVLEGRSPDTGEALSASEYAEQDAATAAALAEGGVVPPEIARLITLLRIRKALRLVLPIIP